LCGVLLPTATAPGVWRVSDLTGGTFRQERMMQLSLVMLAKGSCPVVCCTDCGQEGRLACATSCTDVLVRSSRRVNERQSWYVTQRRMLTHSSTLGQMRVTVLRLRVPHSTSTSQPWSVLHCGLGLHHAGLTSKRAKVGSDTFIHALASCISLLISAQSPSAATAARCSLRSSLSETCTPAAGDHEHVVP